MNLKKLGFSKTAGFSASAYKWLKPQINQFTGARTFRDYASASRPVESIKGARRATQGMAAILKKHNIKVPKGSTVDKEFSKRLEASNLFPSVGESDKLLAKRWSKNVDKWDARRSLLEKAKLK
tara:strand:+ start:148 stop:519 length:372 start_codon:yes stop_codon:yes gene_type:complete